MTNDALADLPADVRTTLYDALTHPRRRRILRLLRERGARLSVDDLAAGVAAAERDVDPADVDPDIAVRVRTALYHAHLPKLRNAGAVEFEPGRRAVAPANLDPFTDVLAAVDGVER